MKLSSFSENIVSVPYERSGETVTLEINIDAFTPAFFREVGKRFEERMRALQVAEEAEPAKEAKPQTSIDDALAFFETEAQKLEVGAQIHAELLAAGILKGWDITDEDGRTLPVTYESLMQLPPLLLKDIWHLSLENADTVKKRAASLQATSDNAPAGSAGLRVVGQAM